VFFKEIVDLGRELFTGMPNLGANITAFFPLETYAATRRFSQGRLGFEGRMILMAEHCGTHLDCPYHFDPDGLTVDQMPLERLILPGHLLDLTHKGVREPITVADAQDAVRRSGRPIRSGTVVIFWTGRDKDWGREGFKTERPYIPAETAQWLVDQRVTLFGTDLIGLDNPDEWWEPTHVAFLKNGLPMVQRSWCDGGDEGFGRWSASPLSSRHRRRRRWRPRPGRLVSSPFRAMTSPREIVSTGTPRTSRPSNGS
jgi:arylformamidase